MEAKNGDKIIERDFEGKKVEILLFEENACNIRFARHNDLNIKQWAVVADNLRFFPFDNYHIYESDPGCEKICLLSDFDGELFLPKEVDKRKDAAVVFIYS